MDNIALRNRFGEKPCGSAHPCFGERRGIKARPAEYGVAWASSPAGVGGVPPPGAPRRCWNPPQRTAALQGSLRRASTGQIGFPVLGSRRSTPVLVSSLG